MKRVGIILTNLYDFSQKAFLNGFDSYCKEKKIKTFVFVSNFKKDYHKDKIQHSSLFSLIYKSNVDIIIILSSPISSIIGKEGLQDFVSCLPNVPIINYGVEIPGLVNIIVDNKKGISLLMSHLIEGHGLRKIAFIKGPDTNQEALDRFFSYKESLSKYKIQYNSKLVAPGSFSPGDGRKGISLIMDVRRETFEAVVCCHDLAAFEVIRALNSRGYSVPEDVAVVGYDNLDISSCYSPSLTTVLQPFFNIGLLAGTYVDNILLKIKNQELSLVDVKIMNRESCGCIRSTGFKTGGDIANNDQPLIDEIIYNARDRIIEDREFGYEIGESGILLRRSIERIADSIIYCDISQDGDDLTRVMEDILLSTLSIQLDAAFWKYVLEEYYIDIVNRITYKDRQIFISSIITRSILTLYEVEKKIDDYRNIDNLSLIQYINFIGDRLLTSNSDEELKDILKNNLSNIRVKNCFIVLYTETPGIGELFFTRNMKNLLDDEVYRFNLSKLLPQKIDDPDNIIYITKSIVINDVEVGYILIEKAEAPEIIYTFLSEKISYGFKNIQIIKKMKSYTNELEDAVRLRTQELQQANNQLQDRYFKDQLTGIYNRRFLEEVLIPQTKTFVDMYKNDLVKRENCYAMIIADLDHFKEVNDIYGHSSGDKVIKELGRIFSYVIRPEDYVIRLGGEEFLLILREFDENYILNIVNKIRKSVSESGFQMDNGDTIFKTCSLGAMMFPSTTADLFDFKSAISIIDKCLYKSKENGRNRGYVINIDAEQFRGCENVTEYITNNFEKCIIDKKIELMECI